MKPQVSNSKSYLAGGTFEYLRKTCPECVRDAPLAGKKSKTTNGSIEETRLYHERYLRAINSPLRRRILRVLKESSATLEELASKTGLSDETLKWHLNILEHGFCVEKENRQGKLVYKITQEGRVVDYVE